MKYDYDLICIGMGPAGMAVTAMAAEMGLKVCGIEKEKIGGECMSVGCIPSKSILSIANYRYGTQKLNEMGLTDAPLIEVKSPFDQISKYLKMISEKKTLKMFDKVELKLNEGFASFVDSHTVKITGSDNEQVITGQKIFIATGTKPMIPPIPGIEDIDILTNLNLFDLKDVPESMTIIGGGAIGCEMAQAFSRLGTKCSIVQMGSYLLPAGDEAAGKLLAEVFEKEGIDVHNSEKITSVSEENNEVTLTTESGLTLKAERLLVAAGRSIPLEHLELDNAGIKYNKRCIQVDSRFRTSVKHIYAVGDCNGGTMLSHVAMHQGMCAIMSAVSPFSLMKYSQPAMPWTVFSEPQISHVGMNEMQLKAAKIKYETHTARYGDYGAAIAENKATGYVKVFTSYFGRVYGVSIVGYGSGEMINEWTLVIQNKIRLHKVMLLAHSFPTMGFLSKRVAELWMMSKMSNPWIQRFAKFFFRNF